MSQGSRGVNITHGFITDKQAVLWLLQNELLALVSVPEVEVWLSGLGSPIGLVWSHSSSFKTLRQMQTLGTPLVPQLPKSAVLASILPGSYQVLRQAILGSGDVSMDG